MTNGIDGSGESGTPKESTHKSPSVEPTRGVRLPEMPPAPPPDIKKKPNLPPHLAAMVKKTQDTARTLLDPLALKDVVARTTRKQEIKVAALMKERPADMGELPRKVEDFRPSTPCGMKWPNAERKTKVMVCSECTRYVYDFTDTTPEEAEELILKMENRKDVVLYKRPDGKFLTGDCPVGIKAKTTRILLMVAGAALLIGGFIFASLSGPSPTIDTSKGRDQQAMQENNTQPKETTIFATPRSAFITPRRRQVTVPNMARPAPVQNTYFTSAPDALKTQDQQPGYNPNNGTSPPETPGNFEPRSQAQQNSSPPSLQTGYPQQLAPVGQPSAYPPAQQPNQQQGQP